MSAAEKIVEGIITMLEPLEVSAVQAVADLVEALVTHPDGIELAAKRQTQALAVKADILT